MVPGADAIERERHDHGWAVRLGLNSVRSIGGDLAATIVAGQPYVSIEDVARRTGCNREQLEALATSGALAGLPADGSSSRRRDLWESGAVAGASPRP